MSHAVTPGDHDQYLARSVCQGGRKRWRLPVSPWLHHLQSQSLQPVSKSSLYRPWNEVRMAKSELLPGCWHGGSERFVSRSQLR